jgi:hypothetical protein
MATAVFPGPTRPVRVPSLKAQAIPSLSRGREASQAGDPTIHRITRTHHGRTLLTLGHAAEYLRRYSTEKVDHTANSSNVEAIHILMELSRRVFDEFAEGRTLSGRFEQWLIERAVGLFDEVAGKRLGGHRGNV